MLLHVGGAFEQSICLLFVQLGIPNNGSVGAKSEEEANGIGKEQQDGADPNVRSHG